MPSKPVPGKSHNLTASSSRPLREFIAAKQGKYVQVTTRSGRLMVGVLVAADNDGLLLGLRNPTQTFYIPMAAIESLALADEAADEAPAEEEAPDGGSV